MDTSAEAKGRVFSPADIMPSLILYMHRYDQARDLPNPGIRTRNLINFYLMRRRAELAHFANALVLKQALDEINVRFETTKARLSGVITLEERLALREKCTELTILAGHIDHELARLVGRLPSQEDQSD